MADTDLSRLIADCIAGDNAAVERLVRQHETGVFRLALSIVGDTAEAHEITQETFIAALRSLRSYEDRKSFKAWLYTIALNHARNHLRKRKVMDRLKTTVSAIFRIDSQKQKLPEEHIIQSEEETALWNAMNKLDERHRIVLVLRYFQELSVTEIAGILDLPEGTIHSRLHTARERLRIALDPAAGD
ncbi:MAG TPA: sigma-70 family RNA polymerase sigma factor [Anaerolineales bacterium]|nr:sigma-70 family RNA polymerase sigma factor [Anaerolineales bacterium]